MRAGETGTRQNPYQQGNAEDAAERDVVGQIHCGTSASEEHTVRLSSTVWWESNEAAYSGLPTTMHAEPNAGQAAETAALPLRTPNPKAYDAFL
jgi:hypothetical protein